MMRKLSAAFVVALAFATLAPCAPQPAAAQSLAQGNPEELGFSAERLGRITKLLRDDSTKGLIPGAILLIARNGKIAHFEAVGALDPQTEAPMTKDGIFRIYSMTKPITSVAAMMLVEDGKLALADPVAKYIPEFKDAKVAIEEAADEGKPVVSLAPARPMRVYDLIRHTSGLTYGVFGDNAVKRAYRESGLIKGDFDNAEFVSRLAKLPLMFQPGTAWEYSHATDVLGRVVEVVSGKSLLAFTKERILDPLGMTDTTFYVTDASKHPRIAEPFKNDRTIGTDAEFFDPREAKRYESGGGGMVGTAMDYARFLQMLLDAGRAGDKQLLGPKTIAMMTSDHLGPAVDPGSAYGPGDGYAFGLGFAVRRENGLSPIPGTAGDYFWNGAGGTAFWVDPKENMFVVFMSQAPKNRAYYRVLLRDMVYAAMTK
jgi:CubicO group peptidase (beta-lactamase class C family)